MSIHVRDITRAGSSLDLEIFGDGEKLGDLTIGSGSIIWRGRNRRSKKRINWTRFAEMLDELAYGA